MSVIHAPEEPKITSRLLIIPIVLLFCFIGFALRLWWIQIVMHDELEEKSQSMGRMVSTTLAPRGKIVDRNGFVIADVRPRVVILGRPKVLLADEETLNSVAVILQTDVKKLQKILNNNRHKGNLPVPIYVGATVPKAAYLQENSSQFPGIIVETQSMRVYNETANTSKIVGWVSVPSEDIEKALKEEDIVPAEYVGRDGIERIYEKELMGVPGRQIVAVDRKGRETRSISNERPTPGTTLHLSLDTRLQELAMKLLDNRKGSIVAIDPNNGEVLCLASAPTFDSAVFEDGLTNDEFSLLFEDENKPMFKRSLAGTYPPGSTFKIVTTLGAAMSGKLDLNSRVYCPGYITVGSKRVRCENHAAGSMDFRLAFTKSCNSYFGKLAQTQGADSVRLAARSCGLGVVTGIDVPGEQGGKVPDDSWVEDNYNRPWSLGDTNNIGIGQGDLLTTPLQMANVAALVANRGHNYKPHLVRAVQSAGALGERKIIEPEIANEIDLPGSFWDTLQGAMVNVVNAGTAKRAQIPGIQVTGKTGSAENPFSRKTHAWFVGYAPAENPQIAFAVILETAGHGGSVSAPLAKEIVREYLGNHQ